MSSASSSSVVERHSLISTYEVTFTAAVHGQLLEITASVVPGSTPFLLARPTLEEWGAVRDYKDGMMKIGNSPWLKPERNARGHFLLDVFQEASAMKRPTSTRSWRLGRESGWNGADGWRTP